MSVAPGCLDENAIAQYVSGAMPEPVLASARDHVSGCASCRQLVSILVDEPDEDRRSAREPAAASTEPGTRIGRYVVLEHVGAGAMGTVFAAWDTELRRKVALKLVHPVARVRGDADEAQGRLLREAQAMARLNHPNVVAVHDAGTTGGDVFITLEWVPGETLADWQKGPRAWREIVRRYLDAGRGLAAAHAAGLVHRDFKPANVLLGEDGRVRVTDFGLAREAHASVPTAFEAQHVERASIASASTGSRESDHAGSGQLTRTGALLGTPAYMSPEQLAGGAADARSDQFSFCVALWEALYGVRPFAGATVGELTRAIAAGVSVTPTVRGNAQVPASVRRALLRGLAVRPEDRHATIESLLSALTAASKSSRRLLTGGIALFAVCAVVAAYVLTSRGNPCSASSRHLAGVWDPVKRAELEKVIKGSGRKDAKSLWASVEGALARYAEGWTRAHTEACQATHVHREQSAELLDARMVCLERRRLELHAVTSEILQAPPAALLRVSQAAHGLTDLSECSAAQVFRGTHAPPEGTPERQEWDALLEALAETKALKDAGRYRDGIERAKHAAALAAAQDGAQALHAEALVLRGELHGHLSEFKEAETWLHEALPLAERVGADAVAATAWMLLTFNVGNQQSRFEEGRRFVAHAHASIERSGTHPALLATWNNYRGLLAFAEQQYEASIGYHQAALALRQRHFGEDHKDTASSHMMLGNSLLEVGREEDALEHYRISGRTRVKLHGPDHPSVAMIMNNIGEVLLGQRDLNGALSHAQRAQAIIETALGPEVPSIAFPLSLVADVHFARGDCERAVPLYAKSLALLEGAHGPKSPFLIRQLAGMGACEAEQGALGRAERRALLERAVTLSELEGADHVFRGQALFALAKVLHGERGQSRNALRLADEAVAAFGKASSPRARAREDVLTWRAELCRSASEGCPRNQRPLSIRRDASPQR